LLANLCLDGYDVDVIPEFLFFYRYRHDSLFRTTDTYANMQRVHRVYQEKLKTLGLEHLMPVTYGLYQRALELPGSVSHTNPDWMARRVPWRHLLTAMLLKVKNKLKR